MKNLIESIKYWGQLLLLPIYWFSFFVPRDKDIWVFGSTFGRRFADNPRYLYTYLAETQKVIRPIWISHNKHIVSVLQSKGFEAYYYLSMKGLLYCFCGKVYVFDNYSKDINFWTSGGAIKVNLWHGVGNKKINYDNEHDRIRHPQTVWEKFLYFPRRLSDEKPSHYILATSPIMKKIFARAFQVKEDHIILSGYPRNDILYDACIMNPIILEGERQLNEILSQWIKQGKKIVGYVPTFRISENKFNTVMNLNIFNKFLKQNNLMFLVKLHPKSQLKTEFQNYDYSNIYNMDSDIDINLFLKKLDVLVTDYSSVYSDFMILDKPVIAFQYDWEEYSKNTRGNYFKFEQYMPELRAKNMSELIDALQRVLNKDSYNEKRKLSRNKIFSFHKPDACQNITKRIIRIINKGE